MCELLEAIKFVQKLPFINKGVVPLRLCKSVSQLKKSFCLIRIPDTTTSQNVMTRKAPSVLFFFLLLGISLAWDGCEFFSSWRCGDTCIHSKKAECKCGGEIFNLTAQKHTCKKRVMLRRRLFWPKKFAEKVRKSRQNVNRDKSA